MNDLERPETAVLISGTGRLSTFWRPLLQAIAAPEHLRRWLLWPSEWKFQRLPVLRPEPNCSIAQVSLPAVAMDCAFDGVDFRLDTVD